MQTCFIFLTYPPFKLNAFDTTGPRLIGIIIVLWWSFPCSEAKGFSTEENFRMRREIFLSLKLNQVKIRKCNRKFRTARKILSSV